VAEVRPLQIQPTRNAIERANCAYRQNRVQALVLPIMVTFVLAACSPNDPKDSSLPIVCKPLDALDNPGLVQTTKSAPAVPIKTYEDVERLIALSSGHRLLDSSSMVCLTPKMLFVCGGVFRDSKDNVTVRQTWLYNLAHKSLDKGPSMARPRFGQNVCLLDDGSVLIVGGDGVLEVEHFDPVSGKIRIIGKLASCRSDFGIVQIDSRRILLIGGVNYNDPFSGPEGEVSSIEVFDLGAGIGRAIGRMNERRIDPQCKKLPNGDVVIWGGSRVIEPDSEPQIVNRAELLKVTAISAIHKPADIDRWQPVR
jgi:hypothetical protein